MGLGTEELTDALNKAIPVDTSTENITKIPTPWTVTASSSGEHAFVSQMQMSLRIFSYAEPPTETLVYTALLQKM